ncbi:MAG: hypothetical protein ACJAXY_000840, partial [Nonlabens sp.]
WSDYEIEDKLKDRTSFRDCYEMNIDEVVTDRSTRSS